MKSNPLASDEVECNLCLGMEWDEAIYCPQCYGSGKKHIREEIFMLNELSRRFANLKSWRWLPGMLTVAGDRVKKVDPVTGDVFLDRGFITLDENNNFAVGYPRIDSGDFPDPRDFATIGAMLEILERATGLNSTLGYSNETGDWYIVMSSDTRNFTINGASKIDALLEAFEYLEENS